MANITIRLVEHGESTVEVDADEYTDAKTAGELDMLLDAWASDIDSETVIVEPDGTRLALATSQPIEPPRAADLPIGSVVALGCDVAVRLRLDGVCLWVQLIDGVQHDASHRTIDTWIADGATVLRVGDGS